MKEDYYVEVMLHVECEGEVFENDKVCPHCGKDIGEDDVFNRIIHE